MEWNPTSNDVFAAVRTLAALTPRGRTAIASAAGALQSAGAGGFPLFDPDVLVSLTFDGAPPIGALRDSLERCADALQALSEFDIRPDLDSEVSTIAGALGQYLSDDPSDDGAVE